MRFVLLALLFPIFALAQPVPIAPLGPTYTQTQPIAARGSGAYCGADKIAAQVAFSWHDTGAAQYELYVVDGCTLPPSFTADSDVVSSAKCASGVCTHTPSVAIANTLIGTWWVREAGGTWSQPFNFAINPPGNNTFQNAPCSWYYTSDAPGQGRRLLDFNTARGGQGFPIYKWTTIDVSDLVPEGTTAILALTHFIFSVSSGEPILSYKTRRHGSTFDPEPYAGLMYSTAHRDPQQMIVLLGTDRKFDFYWSDTANGLGPALGGAGVASAWAINMSVTGYCK